MKISKLELKIMVKEALITSIMRNKLKYKTFFDKKNKKYINDMFNTKKIKLDKCEKQKPKIGKKYQVIFSN
jgi:hypothetical protein